MRRLIVTVVVVHVGALIASPAIAQELYSDPYNCAAQGMQVGGAYECAPPGAPVTPPPPANPVIINQGGYDWYYYGPEVGWWYRAEDGYLYPGFR
jgi:hypothetical protein